MSKVLVTGGAGYVGSHACKALAEAGYEPVVLDNLCRGHADFVRWGPLEKGDLLDAGRVREVITQHQPVAVMHFAALSYVGESVSNPGLYYRNNILGTLNLVEQMVDAGINRLVFSSTCAVYGIPEKLPISESTPKVPINPYGHTKLTVEQLLEDFDAAFGLKSMSLRYFNAAGADPDGEVGERHEPETHAIPLAIAAALGDGPGFKIFGDDYETSDGTAIRDYIHVSDLGAAHVSAIEFLMNGGTTTACNLGTGSGTSVRNIVEAVSRASKRDVPVEISPRRPGDPPELVADPTLAQDMLRWKPKFTGIDDIVDTAVQWHRRESCR